MTLRRYDAKRDTIENEVIVALLSVGCTVQQLSIKGVPDLLVGFSDPQTGVPTNILIEAKSDKGKLTPDQVEWIEKWEGQVFVVRSVEEALLAVGRM